MDSQRQKMIHMAPGADERRWVVGDLVTFKIVGEDVAWAFTLGEELTPPQGGPPWFRSRPYLETSRLEPASVGGLEGERLETTVSVPDDYLSNGCGGNVSPWPVRSGPDECFGRQEKIHVIILDDVEGEAVLDTVEWEGS